jgi:hypothetical protein
MSQRDELVRMADFYGRAGMGADRMRAIEKIREVDESLYYLNGMDAIGALTSGGDPRKLGAVFSYYTGTPTAIQRVDDGTYNIFSVGADAQGNPTYELVESNIDETTLVNSARSFFDKNYITRMQELQSKQAELSNQAWLETIKSNLQTQQTAESKRVEAFYNALSEQQKFENSVSVEEAKAMLKEPETKVQVLGTGEAIIVKDNMPYMVRPVAPVNPQTGIREAMVVPIDLGAYQ